MLGILGRFNWLSWLIYIAASAAIALLLRRHVFMLAWVKGSSMLDTLRSGEVMFARRYGHRRNVARFDVVLCRYPGRREMFVKRVVALPGECVELREDALYIDGVPVGERFARRRCLRAFAPQTLAADRYFVMGDNRPVSRDSRSPAVGALPREAILARCTHVLWPPRAGRRII